MATIQLEDGIIRMVVGDVVNWCSNGTTTYVPAGTVQLMVVQAFFNGQTMEYGIEDAVDWARQYVISNQNEGEFSPAKFGITNSQYYRSTAKTNTGFSAIQIK